MKSAMFIPFSVAGGYASGFIAKKAFEAVWSMIDDEEPPDSEFREIDYRKLAAALAIEGAVFSLARGFFDHGARHGYLRLTGSWPGDEAPEAQ